MITSQSSPASPSPSTQPTELVTEEDGKTCLNVCVVGHVDVGKSTVLGHLFVKLGLIDTKLLHKLNKEATELGKQTFHFAFVLDTYQAERQRGVTMDVATYYFDTPTKHVTVLDCPGHEELVPRVITGVCQADVAIYVVNANLNEFEATFERSQVAKQHLIILRHFGITQLIVAMNKMDLCKDQADYVQIQETLLAFLKRTGFQEKDIHFVPISGYTGENLTERCNTSAPWYSGPCLLEVIDSLPSIPRHAAGNFRMPIAESFKPLTGGVTIGGRIECGRIAVGDKFVVLPSSGEPTQYTVKTLHKREVEARVGVAGDNVELGLQGVSEVVGLSQGTVACSGSTLPKVGKAMEIQVAVLATSPKALVMGLQVMIHTHTAVYHGTVIQCLQEIDKKGTLVKNHPKCLRKESFGIVSVSILKGVVCAEVATDIKNCMSRVILREGHVTLAVGVIKNIIP